MKTIIDYIKSKPFAFIGISLVLGLFFGWIFFGGTNNSMSGTSEEGMHNASEHESDTEWTCSMHPQIRQDKPGSCPICGMELIPITDDQSEEGFDPDAVILSASAAKIAEVESVIIAKGDLNKLVVLPGKVNPDERRIHELTAHFPGRIDALNVNYTGQFVKKGQVLAKIFSPDLVTAQKELFETIKYKESNPKLYAAARNKFKLWLFTEEQIDQIENSGDVEYFFDLLSPGSGTVTKRNISLGDHVMEGMSMFQIIDLRRVWIEFDAYESDIPWIRIGSNVSITIKSIPGEIFNANVTFIDPVLNEQTRTTIVRTEISNTKGLLRPGMFAQAKVSSNISKEKALLVPKSAVLWTGKKSVVYVEEKHEKSAAYHYREISLGVDTGTHYVVLDGLSEGESVVKNGAFKIDAAAQLKGSTSMMNPDGGKVSTGHNHGESSEAMNTAKEDEHTNHNTSNEVTRNMSMSVDKDFKNQLTAVYKSQLGLQEAFISSDAKMVQEQIPEVVSSLDKVDMSLVKGEMHDVWMSALKKLSMTLDQIQSSDDIEKQRLSYSDFNDALYAAIKFFGTNGEIIHYQFCPMANGNKGSYWLSATEEIRNPYFGDAMLKCGETKEIIK